MGAIYQHEAGFYASADLNHVSESFERINQDQSKNDEIIPSRTIVNAKLGYRGENYGVYLIASNVFDEEYYFNDFETVGGVNSGRYGEPRLIGLSLEAGF